MSDMSVKEAYQVLQAACGIEVGDKVKVLRTCEPHEMGYELDPYNEQGRMSRMVGKIGVIDTIGKGHLMINVEGAFINVPFFCLELVEKAPKATYLPSLDVIFEKDGLSVGGTFVSKDTIRRNLDF